MGSMTPEEERFERIERNMAELTDLTLRIGRIVEEQGRRSEASGRETDERIRALAEAQMRTEDRLNTVINVVERYFSNGRHPQN